MFGEDENEFAHVFEEYLDEVPEARNVFFGGPLVRACRMLSRESGCIADYNTYPRAISTRKEPRDHQGRQEQAFLNQSGRLLRAPRPKVIIPNISCWLLFKEKLICLVDCFDSTRMPVSSQGGRLRSAQRILPLLRLGKKLVC